MSRTRRSRMPRGPPTPTRCGERVREGKRCEPMQEASSEHCARQCGGGRVSVTLVERWTALMIAERGGADAQADTSQPSEKSCERRRPESMGRRSAKQKGTTAE